MPKSETRSRALALLLGAIALPAAEAQEPLIRSLAKAGPPEKCVNVLFVGDGYTKEREAKFWRDVDRYSSRLLNEPPFSWYKDKFDVRGLFVASADRGCDMDPQANKVRTQLESHFDSPDGRLLIFKDHDRLRDLVQMAGDVDITFVMVDVEKYGGGGSVLPEVQVRGRALPAPTFAAQDTPSFMIAIHELGHSFADLADEYTDPASAKLFPLPADGKDLAAANVTLAGKFDPTSFATLRATLKWRHLLELPGAAQQKSWVVEGGYFRDSGVFRPWRTCMMFEFGARFCPVCMEEMAKAIVAASGDVWDDAAYHKKHPLKFW
ncbi:MAG TPA: M64 family metallopeptidase, partial [Planctomycetota bacterium]|nr:M64 family metallopeptidase [Planctomycetota bacterium]